MAKRVRGMKAAEFGVANVVVEVLIEANAKSVWRGITAQVKKGGRSVWWPVDFVSSEKTKRFVIESGLGGRWYEDFGVKGSGVLWYTNVVWEPEQKIAMTGVSLPGCGGGGPTVSNVVITLTPEGKHTRVRLSDESLGRIDEEMRGSLVAGWGVVLQALKIGVEDLD